MKKIITISLIILAVFFGILATFSMQNMSHSEHSSCPISVPGCSELHNSKIMLNLHLSLLKIFGQNMVFFKLLLALVFFIFYLSIININNKAPSAHSVHFNLKKPIIFQKILRWMSIIKFSYPATIFGA